MKKKGFSAAFLHAVALPMLLWLSFIVISFFFGFTSYPDLAQQQMLSNSAPFIITFAFGLWIGAESFRNFSFRMTLFNAFIVSFIVGLVTVLLTSLLVNDSGIFLTYATSIYSKTTVVSTPLIDLAISTAISNIFTALASTAAAYALLKVTYPEKK